MKRSIAFVIAALLAVLSAKAYAQHEFPKPGPEHEKLKAMAGDWKSKIKFMEPGSDEAQESTGSMSAKVELGGFFLITTTTDECTHEKNQSNNPNFFHNSSIPAISDNIINDKDNRVKNAD